MRAWQRILFSTNVSSESTNLRKYERFSVKFLRFFGKNARNCFPEISSGKQQHINLFKTWHASVCAFFFPKRMHIYRDIDDQSFHRTLNLRRR
jgi:hypothetical protein